MGLTLTNVTLSNPADKGEVEQNFEDIQSKFDGNIVNSDISTNASITIGKIETLYERMTVQLKFVTNDDGTGTNLRTWSDLSGGDIVDAVCLPGDGSDNDWDVVDASWVCNAVGAGSDAFRVEWGYYDNTATTGDGTWNTTSTPISATTIAQADSGGANTGNQGHPVDGGSTTLTFDNSPNFRSLALIANTAADTTCMDAMGDFLVVSITLRKAIANT